MLNDRNEDVKMNVWSDYSLQRRQNKNKYVRRNIGISQIVGEIKKNRLRWQGRFMRKIYLEAVEVIVIKTYVKGKKRKNKPRKIGQMERK